MDLKRFEACADAYGAARRRWPVREHATYDRFAGSPEGRAMLARAQRLDRALDAWEPEESAAELALLSLARLPGGASLWLWASSLAASATLGFTLGFLQTPDETSDLLAQLLLGLRGAWMIGL